MAVVAGKNSEVLGEFAWEIIDHPKSLFFLDKDGSGDIDWLGSERDMVVFAQILKILEATQDLDDNQFLEQCLEEIESLLDYSSLFIGLDSPHIAVTPAHEGTTPKKHILNVLKKIRTTGVSSEIRILLRFEALLHDVGKASAAGLSQEEIAAVLEGKDFPHNQSSYPDHEKISVLVAKKIRRELDSKFRLDKNILTNESWTGLEFVILHHHFIQYVFEDQTLTLSEFTELISHLERSQILSVLISLYLLNIADVDANDSYRNLLPEMSANFGKVFREINSGLLNGELGKLFAILYQYET